MSPAPRPRPRPRAVTFTRGDGFESGLRWRTDRDRATAPAPHAPYAVHRARKIPSNRPDPHPARAGPNREPAGPPTGRESALRRRRSPACRRRPRRRAFHSGFALPPATRGGAPVVYLNVVLAAIRACVRLHGTLPRSIRPTSRTILDHSLLRCTGFSAVVFRHRIRTGCSLLEYVRDRFTTHP